MRALIQFPYVNAKTQCLAKVLLTCWGTFVCLSCVSTPESKDQEKEEKILDSQIDVAVNYLNNAQPLKAHAELKTLLFKHPEDARILNLMGLSYLALKQPRLALGYFVKAEDEEENPAYKLNRTSALIELKRYNTAAEMLKEMAAEKGDQRYAYPERIYHNLGLAFERSAKPAIAEKYYRLALDLSPTNYITLMRLGEMKIAAKNYLKAAEYFEEAMKACKGCFDPRQHLVRIRLQEGNKNAAVTILRNYLAEAEIRKSERQSAQDLLAKIDPSFVASKASTTKQ